jgi:hypothetical protein
MAVRVIKMKMLKAVTILTILFLSINCTSPKGKEKLIKNFTDEELDEDYELKSEGLERILGKSDSIVGHAIIPFEVGGSVDMYYYHKGVVNGTGFATMELIQPDGTGPIPNRNGTYELVAFTKLKLRFRYSKN